MEKIVFALPGNESLSQKIVSELNVTKREPLSRQGRLDIRRFPDGETYVRVIDNVSGKDIILICTLNYPDDKLLALFFLSKNLKDLGAKKITLIAPYLAYMRQDKKFKPGEAITSNYFAKIISEIADELITIDPHLHRRHSMSEIYSIPCKVLHASGLIAGYIKNKINDPLLIGPDSESEQWVSEVALSAKAPFIILEKERRGDKDVRITVPQIEKYKNCTPVLIDDIISTAHTMMETIQHLKNAGMKMPVCIGVHPIFAGNAFEELKSSGAAEIISCNTIMHESNKIDITDLIGKNIEQKKHL